MQDEPTVLGVILAGSYAKGFQTPKSDIDVYVIVSDESDDTTMSNLKNDIEESSEGVIDLSPQGVQTISNLETYATVGSNLWWDRYNLLHSIIEIDKTNGALERILSAKKILTEQERNDTLQEHLGPYINMTYRATASNMTGNNNAALLDASQGVRHLINCLFALERRVTPFNKYLQWELKNHPLKCMDETEQFELILRYANADIAAHKLLFKTIKEEASKYESKAVFEAWGSKLDIMT